MHYGALIALGNLQEESPCSVCLCALSSPCLVTSVPGEDRDNRVLFLSWPPPIRQETVKDCQVSQAAGPAGRHNKGEGEEVRPSRLRGMAAWCMPGDSQNPLLEGCLNGAFAQGALMERCNGNFLVPAARHWAASKHLWLVDFCQEWAFLGYNHNLNYV